MNSDAVGPLDLLKDAANSASSARKFCLLNESVTEGRSLKCLKLMVGMSLSPRSPFCFLCLVLRGEEQTGKDFYCLLGELAPLSLCNVPFYL